MPVTNEQYEAIKEYVLARLKSVESFSISNLEFPRKFNLGHPYFRELVDRVSKDGLPFVVESDYPPVFGGDSSGPIEFSRSRKSDDLLS